MNSTFSDGDERPVGSLDVELADAATSIKRKLTLNFDNLNRNVQMYQERYVLSYLLIATGIFLLLFLTVRWDLNNIPSGNSDLVFNTTLSENTINKPMCTRMLQSIRSAYYKNEGEYICAKLKGAAGGNPNINCIEWNANIQFGIFTVDFQRNGACIDFSSGEAMCYFGYSGGAFVGLALSTAVSMSVVCPNTIDDVTGFGVSVCMPEVSFLGSNLWPGFCFEKNRLGPVGGWVYRDGGYSINFGLAGLDVEMIIFSVTGGEIFSNHRGVLDLDELPTGVERQGLRSLPYSFEWLCIWVWLALAAYFLWALFCKRGDRLYTSFVNTCCRKNVDNKATSGVVDDYGLSVQNAMAVK